MSDDDSSPTSDQRAALSSGAPSGHRADPPASPWRTVAAHEVYRNSWMTVIENQVIRPDGQPGIYGVVDIGDNATIVPLDADGRVCLAGQFAYPVGEYLWSLPGGWVDGDEEPLAAARRELAEETGLTATEWTPLGSYYLTPGIATQVSHIYLARGLHEGAAQPEGTEQITTRWLPLAEALESCLRGEIRDAVSAIGLWRAARLVEEEARRG